MFTINTLHVQCIYNFLYMHVQHKHVANNFYLCMFNVFTMFIFCLQLFTMYTASFTIVHDVHSICFTCFHDVICMCVFSSASFDSYPALNPYKNKDGTRT